MRFQAAMIAVAQGQAAAILRVLRRPPRTSRRRCGDAVAQRLRLCLGELAVQGGAAEPGQPDAGCVTRTADGHAASQ
jgi:hypothetical protein